MQPHTGSYYAATANEQTDYPPLQGDQLADVCVIGAGFTGIATALTLAERGYDVRVVEANKVGWGASGRNGGQMIGGIAGEKHVAKACDADMLWQMHWRGHDIIAERVEKYGIECDLKYGYVDVAIKPRHLRDFQEEFDYLEKHGFEYEHRMLDRDETRELIGTDAYLGALLNMRNGHLHPLNLCIGEARAATGLGVKIHEGSEVLRIEHGARPKVVTADASVTADSVVIAGNAYHLVEPKLRGIMFPVNSFIIATEPLTAEQVASVNPHDLAVCDPNFVLQYYRLSADKRFLFGARINTFGDDPAYIAKHHLPLLLRLYPQLEGIGVDYAWGGTIGVPLHRVPRIGQVAPNVFYSQGYSGHGVNVTHLAGEIMADAIAGTLERFDIFAGIKSTRFPGSHTFRKPLVALGVLYHQIRDKL
ncbi:MAG: FAD-dependent oxidoreductase [Woeseiaceae bacterium]|nr:FAD-dependent oxidoreductase [Woeseiaceae bacterium]